MPKSSALSTLVDRLAGWPRRIAAVLCLVLAAGSALSARASPVRRTSEAPLSIAARDLASGTTLASADLRIASWPEGLRPSGAFADTAPLVGRRLAGPVRAGEAITGVRLLDGDVTAGLPSGFVAVPVTLAGGAAAGIVHAGQWVDLLAPVSASTVDGLPDGSSSSAAPTAVPLADNVRVLAVVSVAAGGAATSTDNTPVVVAVDRPTALRLASRSGAALLVTLRAPP